MPSFPPTLPRICVALGLPTADLLTLAAEVECKDGNAFLEFRLDAVDDPEQGITAVRAFCEKHADAWVLATCRHKQHHGGFKGTLERQVQVLRDAADAGAFAVDLEIESAECVKPLAQMLRKRAALIVSFHDFDKTPALETVLRRLQKVPADGYKIAATALKPSDNCRLVAFARERRDDDPLIALAMSEMGNVTRILGPALGSCFTYAAPSQREGTAPGQISARVMRSLYRADKLTKKTKVYGVIADPVAHSKSPLLHNRGFQSRRLNSVYLPFRVASTQLGEFMKFAEMLPVAGLSVTIPHKQKILRYLDVVDPLAKRIGAVNTVWRKAGKWRGANTDTQGVLKPLAKHLRLSHSTVLLAGYGGAARAAAIALSDAGAKLTITGRDLESAQALARIVKAEAVSLAEAIRGDYDALLHATPVGMAPKTEATLFPDRIPSQLVFDMVYNPQETLLLRQAKAQGATIIFGTEMLLEQAFAQFEIWTGEAAPWAVMRAALETAL